MKFDISSQSLATLILMIFILVSSTDNFDNLYTTTLGRIIIIIILVIISFLDKLYGLIAVIFIIVIITTKTETSVKDGFQNYKKSVINVVTHLKKVSPSGEGNDLIGREHSMKKGKQSKSINVDKNVRNAEKILPNDNVFAKENFTRFE
jgi:hypothetical protein